MLQLKRRLAMFLAVLMLIAIAPVTAFAEETTPPGGPNATSTDVPLDDLDTIEPDTVVYNLGSQEITVGFDADQAEAMPWNYKLFDENCNYTIQLEDNALFPYEVQFAADGTVTTEWFDTPDSTVQIAGHTFGVHTEQNDDTKLSQIGVWIDGDYIAARPEPKTFTNPMIMPMSLLPLNEVSVTLDLSSYNRFQLKNVQVSAILSGLTPSQSVGSGGKVVWTRYGYDDEKIVTQADTIDLSGITSSTYTLELIVGSALQLDDTNTRYIVTVTNGGTLVADSVSIYKTVGGTRSAVTPIRESHYTSTGSYDEYLYSYLTKADIAADAFYVGLAVDSAYINSGTVKAYKGSFNSAESAEAAAVSDSSIDVTGRLLNQTMANADAGFMFTAQANTTWYQQTFTLVFEDGGTKQTHRIELGISSSNEVYAYDALYAVDSTYSNIVNTTNQAWSNGIEVYTYTLDNGYSASGTHYLRLRYMYGGSASDANRSYVSKAVVGHFDSESAATGESDIKDDLFPINSSTAGAGYAADYSGNGQNFTIFDMDGEVHKITVKAVDAPPESPANPRPNPGSSDTYFRVNGANELTNVYVLPYEHDTYYDVGYQTVFYTDNVPLSSLTPTFWTGTAVDMYSGHSGNAGTLQVSGTTTNDFSRGAVQYSAGAQNRVNLKNYWITFVKQETGAKLFVNGINGDDGAKREVFLTSVHDNLHDIFIANIGDAPLTGLSATLSADAQNIKLDPYWTVGGAGNDTLAAFTTTTKTPGANNGELANVAKIRLLPDGEGEISGTLTITANGQTPVVITLTGNAGNPKLTTTSIPEAVKYVPYAVQIMHNNKYDWNTVSLSISSGTLPAGVELKQNGELYGVPRETGSFTFRIQMTNSDSRFGSSSATYTLVVNDNTNINVDNSTDTGYDVTQRVGTHVGTDDIVTTIADHVFITDGEMGEFIDFWLNGEKLVENTDYTREAGSTKITIRSQTFENKADQDGTNTIAAEFRIDGSEEKELKRAAQNFVMDIESSGQDPNNNPGSNNSYTSSSNSYYAQRTITEGTTGVSVMGSLASNARITVGEASLHPVGECDVCDEIRARTDAGELIALYDISVSGGYSGLLEVAIPVGTQYNGQSATIIHCADKIKEAITMIVQDGKASGMFSGFSPFAVVMAQSDLIAGLPDAYTMLSGQSMSWTPVPSGGTWSFNSEYLSMTQNGNQYTFTALKEGQTILTYTVDGVSYSMAITIYGGIIPQTGGPRVSDGFSLLAIVLSGFAAIAGMGAMMLIMRKRRVI